MRGQDIVYTPAMNVLIKDRTVPQAQEHVRHLLEGHELVWDQPPMAREPWPAFFGVCSAIAQVVRLFGKEVEYDQWGEQRRMTLMTLDWDPLPYDFGWRVLCHPFAGVTFTRDPQDLPPGVGLRYLMSWTHGHFTQDELRRWIPPLRERLITLALRLQDDLPPDEDNPGFSRRQLEEALMVPHELPRGLFVDLFGLGDDGGEERDAWQLRRALLLLRAMTGALALKRDLVCLGY